MKLSSLKILCLSTIALSAATQAHATDVCDRSKAAQEAIEVASMTFDFKCDHITEKELKNITSLGLNLDEKGDSLRPGDFDDLPNLESITISCPGAFPSPPIPFPRGVFENLNNLTNLSVFDCNFTSLPDYIYRKFPKLKNFEFETRGLQSLPLGIYERSPLTEVTLYLKSPGVLNSGAFEGSHIQKLTLNFDEGGEFKSKYFKGLNQLTTLEIQPGGKGSSKLGKDTFSELVNLNSLKFQYGSFTEIAPNAFEGLKNIENLDFESSYKEELPDLAFSNMPALKTMKLEIERTTGNFRKCTSSPSKPPDVKTVLWLFRRWTGTEFARNLTRRTFKRNEFPCIDRSRLEWYYRSTCWTL